MFDERIIRTFEDLTLFVNFKDDDEVRFVDAQKVLKEMAETNTMTVDAFMHSHMFIGYYGDLKGSKIYNTCLDCRIFSWDKKGNVYYVVVDPNITQYMDIVCNVKEPLLSGSKLGEFFTARMKQLEKAQVIVN